MDDDGVREMLDQIDATLARGNLILQRIAVAIEELEKNITKLVLRT